MSFSIDVIHLQSPVRLYLCVYSFIAECVLTGCDLISCIYSIILSNSNEVSMVRCISLVVHSFTHTMVRSNNERPFLIAVTLVAK